MEPSLTPDQQVGCLASLQHGAITYVQAIAAGLSPDAIRHRVQTGRWRRVARGVFVVAGTPATWQQDAMTGCLAGPSGTVASHLTAAALLGVASPPDTPHVTTPRKVSGRKKGATVHRADLRVADTSVIDGIPVTAPARTVVDCAALLAEDSIRELLDDVLCRRLCTQKEIVQAMERAGPRRAGCGALGRALEVWTEGTFPGSPAEMRLVRRLVGWRFPIPERQIKIFDASGAFVARVDVGWSNDRAGLEYYGERYHGPRANEHDTRRMLRVEATGWRVRVVTKHDLRGPGARALREWLAAHVTVPDAVALSGVLPR